MLWFSLVQVLLILIFIGTQIQIQNFIFYGLGSNSSEFALANFSFFMKLASIPIHSLDMSLENYLNASNVLVALGVINLADNIYCFVRLVGLFLSDYIYLRFSFFLEEEWLDILFLFDVFSLACIQDRLSNKYSFLIFDRV